MSNPSNASKLSAGAAEFRPVTTASESSPTASSSGNMPQVARPSYQQPPPRGPSSFQGPPQHQNWNNYNGGPNGGRFHHPNPSYSQHNHHVNPNVHHGGYNAHAGMGGGHFNPIGSVQVGQIAQPHNFHAHHGTHGSGPASTYGGPQHTQYAPHQPMHTHVSTHHPPAAGHLMQPPSRDQMRPVPVALLSSALLCLAAGPLEGAKSQLCQLIEEKHGYLHINLEDQVDDEGKLTCSRLEALEQQLTEAMKSTGPQKPRGFVIENALGRCKQEIFLVDDMLQRLKIRLLDVVLLNASGVSEEDVEYVKHPIGFEACATCLGESRVIVINPEDSTFDGAEALAMLLKERPKLFDFTSEPLPSPLDSKTTQSPLPPVGGVESLVLLHDSKLTFQIIRSVATTLGLSDIFTSCWTSAARVLEYSFFTRRSHYLRSFFTTPLMDGERVAVVGYGHHVYLVLATVGLCYRVHSECVPSTFLKLVSESTDEKPLTFIFTAVAGGALVAITDALLINGLLGTALFAYERMALLESVLPSESQKHGVAFRLATYAPLQEIPKEVGRANGFTIINPGVAAPGSFERQNFVWWSNDYKSFDVRLWNGSMKTFQNEEYWVFDAFVVSGEGEGPVTHSVGNNQDTPLQVLIPDKKVADEVINDGNVVEVTFHEQPTASGAVQGLKGGKAAAKTPVAANGLPPCYLMYTKRKPFATHPTSRVFADVLCGNTPKWPKESFSRCAGHLTHLPMTRTSDETKVNEKPEFKAQA